MAPPMLCKSALPVGSKGTFVHFPTFNPESRIRERSAPTRSACGSVPSERLQLLAGGQSERKGRPNPQKKTRERLEKMDVADLCGTVRSLGLPQLCCQEDLDFAESLLPRHQSGQFSENVDQNYLSKLSWHQLLCLVRSLAEQRREKKHEEVVADYLVYACECLLHAHLRELVSAADNSVLPWRMYHCCMRLGLSTHWSEISDRLDRNMLLVCSCGDEPTLLFKEEAKRLRRLVADCRVVRLEQVVNGSQKLDTVAVLYVAGHYDGRNLGFENVALSGTWLVILNMCKTEPLARQLIRQGVSNIVCWPAKVPDGLAADFGVAVIAGTLEHSIIDAFHNAMEAFPSAENRPQLFSRADEANVELPEYVTLECYRNPKNVFIGKQAKVLWHTRHNGWVHVISEGVSMQWRVGFWTAAQGSHNALQSQSVEIGPNSTLGCGCQSHEHIRNETVLLETREGQRSGKAEYGGQMAKVLWDTASNGWVNVKLDSGIAKWRVGHWTSVCATRGENHDGNNSANNFAAKKRKHFATARRDENLPPQCTSNTATPEHRKKSCKSCYAGGEANISRESAAHGYVKFVVNLLRSWRELISQLPLCQKRMGRG